MRRSVPSAWAATVIVCAKCEKKLGGGFGAGGKQRLSKLLAKRAGGGKGRKAGIGVISSKCLKLCPKRAITVIDGARPAEWLIVPGGMPIEEVETQLGLRVRAPGG
ncbi:(2Fe-2S) ferredoxin domain-containing protein [Sphingomonas sp. BIUV-7]|uniref:(2Fe-2S) ferredoxin domain-containing protein n=1 Tax=Sphingomonas natans TaxID=3063330 RepID=A0ABT8Y4G5_9SPHN|nr:(2Fe-2S) ferredoxin domain-containing protein [Sphingomonas sp. BIUV-7]MDO6413196.1 (2Fe-2S) ferredoxin domain-containing protein [Sphingomonas sp. BIUV-7]